MKNHNASVFFSVSRAARRIYVCALTLPLFGALGAAAAYADAADCREKVYQAERERGATHEQARDRAREVCDGKG